MWKLLAAIFIGRVVFEIALRRSIDTRRSEIDCRAPSWIWSCLIGMTLIDLFERYGKGAHNVLPYWSDLLVVIARSLVIFYHGLSLAMARDKIHAAVESDA